MFSSLVGLLASIRLVCASGFYRGVGERDVGRIIATYRAALRPIQHTCDFMHRPAGYARSTPSMRWKILFIRCIDIILESQAAQTLTELDLCAIDSLTSAGVLRLVRGCTKVNDLYWYASSGCLLTPLTDGNGQNVDDITELLESRGKQGSEATYVEIEVFPEYGPWKRGSYHFMDYPHSQHPPGL